ncbi:hypothetical protein CLCR_07292 [Cladophialophora carrionii]|uniref:Uncharacterized protein n=1 Tax=Cladophialophora carrionii TaxID=86049 RepID=A0A1C1CQ39_9EURO|nr:hypothetical protein CLCR_07292 [Cladophialophora carrionii]
MPDINSVPRSPQGVSSPQAPTPAAPRPPSLTASRRTSTQMLPPPLPQNTSLPSSPRPTQAAMMDNTGVGIGPGPIRHPRPLTAAELHLELEKEQESIVNRLTRELSALRAQTASVASTTSSTSDHFFAADPYGTNTSGNAVIPTTTRRHRSSSNLSTRSARSIREGLVNAAANTSVSGVAAPRDQSVQASARPSMEMSRPDVSRQNSTSASGFRSGSITSSPHMSQGTTYAYPHRSSVSSSNVDAATSAAAAAAALPHAAMTRSPSSNAALAQARYEEAALQRAELDAVKRENEALRARVKHLEKSLQRANEAAMTTATGTPTSTSTAP